MVERSVDDCFIYILGSYSIIDCRISLILGVGSLNWTLLYGGAYPPVVVVVACNILRTAGSICLFGEAIVGKEKDVSEIKLSLTLELNNNKFCTCLILSS